MNQPNALPAPPPAPLAAPPGGAKSPFVAGLLAVFPGVGHVYNGLYARGIAFFLAFVSLIYLTSRGAELLGMGIAFTWIFNVVDAVRQATLINHGYARDLGLADLPPQPRPGQGGLAVGVLLFAIGLFALLDKFYYIDLDWVLDWWPLAVMLFGAWLIWGWVRDRRREHRTEEAA